MDELRGFAKAGWDSIPDEWLRTYFRWREGDGEGVLGGRDTARIRFYAISPERRVTNPAVAAIIETAHQHIFS